MYTRISPASIMILAALTAAAPSLASSIDQPLVRPGEALTAEEVAQLRGSDAVNIYQTTREELLKIGDPRCKVRLDPSQMDFDPPAIDKRNFRTIAADAQYVPDTVYVRFKPGTTLEQKAQAHAAIGNVQINWESCLVNDLYQIALPGLNVPAAVNAYLDNPAVLYAEPSYLSSRDDTPNDPSFVDLWGLKAGTGGIRAEYAWDEATDASNIIVAVVDSGVDHTHADITSNMWVNPGEIQGNGIDDDGNGRIDDFRGWNFAANNNSTRPSCSDHGTHVAGTIGAVGDNNTAVAGICWRVKIMAVRCEYTPDTTCRSLANTAMGVEYAAANGARIVNCSYGGGPFSQADFDVFAAAQAAGMTAACAAGNGGSDGVGDNNDSSP
ncbi:MAG: S8 family serine peptidase, partial [Planctomycetota bacterium]|nr:S8 family serine peptidase [Planctomycetota bacterium]